MKLDRIDLRILKTLQQRGKITNVQLSQEVGLSPGPTLERVRKLESSGVIESYHARLNQEKMGLGFKALINVTLARQKDNAISNFIKHINATEEVVECLQLTGSYDYQLKVIVKDIPNFERLIGEKLSKMDEIGSIQSSVVLSELKNNPLIPIDYDAERLEIRD